MAGKKLKTKLSRLEMIVDTLEQDDLDLEKSGQLFEEGMKLVKECGGDLDGIEKKISVLTADGETVPYEGEVLENEL